MASKSAPELEQEESSLDSESTTQQIILKVPRPLYEQIKKSARQNYRAISAEILFRLHYGVPADDQDLPDVDIRAPRTER